MLARRPLAAAATAMTAALLALTALSGCASANAASNAALGKQPATSSATSAEHVAVIGDSIESGLGLDPSEAWPALIASDHGWRLDNLSVPGAGFVAEGSDGHDFSAQVDAAIAAQPDLVLIGASDNDLGTDPDQLSTAMRSTVDRLAAALPDARIAGFNALSGQASDEELAAGDTALRQAVLDAGGTWLDLGQPYRGKAGLVQDDDEHPTLPGQQAIAAVVAAKLSL
ncbi:SGNH/GDSL hydrolase family protein [Leifsonia sp. NPDC014704]|uniref:SGNH/GDSL hydrolase family protein n=1 Tax=Leifsonia sp. NPDC014704 TaxID=3364123 RepID=UPI0036F4753F